MRHSRKNTLLLARRVFSFLVLASFLVIMLPRSVKAQVLYGSVTGRVTDQTNAVVPGVHVTLTNVQTGLSRQSTTNGAGQYAALDLPQGVYTVDVSARSFKHVKKTNVTVAIGQVNQQDFQLQPGAATQSITVQGSAAVLQTQTADVHTTITSHALENLPTNVYRNFQNAELLAPGVVSLSGVSNSYPNGVASGPERSYEINSVGLPGTMNVTRVDGATSINMWLPDHVLILPPQEAIQEVNVQTANYNVEKGLTAGAATDVVIKSGTNEWHGSLYGFHTDTAIDANNYFATRAAPAENLHNNDGATLGGPIKKNKLFFFSNWDGTWEHLGITGTDVLPPQSYRDGDYSPALGPSLFDQFGNPVYVCTTEGGTTQLQEGMVFDPTTGNTTNGTGRCVFSSNGKINVIPPSRLVAGAQKFWPLLPQPTIPGAITQSTAFNDRYSTVQALSRQQGIARIDWNLTDRHLIFGDYNILNSVAAIPMEHGAAGGTQGYNALDQFQTITIGHTWTLSPHLVLTGHIGWAREAVTATSAIMGQPLGQTVLGIPGTNEPTSDIRYSGFPGISMSGWATLGNGDPSTPYTRHDFTLTTSHNLSWVRGNHEFRVGVDAADYNLDDWQPELCCLRGGLDFSEGMTSINLPADPANPANGQFMGLYTSSGTSAGNGYTPFLQNSVAAFNLGYMSEVDKSFQSTNFTAKNWQYGIYFGDRWKVTPKLTADLGIRWEYYPMITRHGPDKFERYVPETNTLLLGGIGGNPVHLGVTTSKKLFDPRIGLTYQFNDKTVARAGFGIANDATPLERPLRGFYPFVIAGSNFVPSSHVSTFLPYTTFAQGIPPVILPDTSSGAIHPPPNVTIGTPGLGEFKRGYVQSWNLFVEQQLPGQVLLNIGYVGNNFVHQLNGRNINAAPFLGGSSSQPLSKFGNFGSVYQYQGYLNSHYNSLQVTLIRRVSQGLFLQGAYTFSKVMGYESANSYQNNLTFQCPPSSALPQGCQSLNRSVLSFDHTHVLKMAFIYRLPFGIGQKWASPSRVANTLISGWQVNGIFTGLTGDPLAIRQNTNNLNTPGTPEQPNYTGSFKYVKSYSTFGGHTGLYWFNPSAFTPNTSATEIGDVGNRLSWLRGPGVVQLDASMMRHIKVSERFDLEVRAEATNVTNSPHFSDPGSTCTNVSGQCRGSFGQITSSFGQRIVQLGMLLRF